MDMGIHKMEMENYIPWKNREEERRKYMTVKVHMIN